MAIVSLAAPSDRFERNAYEAGVQWLRDMRAPPLRTMRQWAEEEVVIPDGPFVGRRFRCSRQPYAGLWFDLVDSGRWPYHVATGPSQSGKTLSCFAIPTLYHLFELQETVICGLPDMDMAADKWRADLLPVIEKTRYRDLLPRSGTGARGGGFVSLTFRNGATLRFMSGGGSDKSRAGFTSRVLVVTETDGLAIQTATSVEADKVAQLLARLRSYSVDRRRVYMECTVSTTEGRTWVEYQGGTCSRIALLCPHCRAYSTPERGDLHGWTEATNEVEARAKAWFACPACGEGWSEEDRRAAHECAQVVHRGQTIDADGVHGEPPQTLTLGFRWSGVNNLFASAADLGADEWKASRAIDQDNAEREQKQFVWCLPVEPDVAIDTPLDPHALVNRTCELPRGVCPADIAWLTVGVDINKHFAHWCAVAWSPRGDTYSGHAIAWDTFGIRSNTIGEQAAIIEALREFRDKVCLVGWVVHETGELFTPDWVLVDARYQTDTVYEFTRESDSRFIAAMGRGQNQERKGYTRPRKTGNEVVGIGEEYHVVNVPAKLTRHLEINVDHWKTVLHDRLAKPMDQPGAVYLHAGDHDRRATFCKHLTAERKVIEWVPDKGEVVRWITRSKTNHYLDAAMLATVGGHLCGVREAKSVEQPRPETAARPRLLTPDGQPYLITEREE